MYRYSPEANSKLPVEVSSRERSHSSDQTALQDRMDIPAQPSENEATAVIKRHYRIGWTSQHSLRLPVEVSSRERSHSCDQTALQDRMDIPAQPSIHHLHRQQHVTIFRPRTGRCHPPACPPASPRSATRSRLPV